MKNIAIIPARMGSTRFPGKPLADIYGLPMVAHVALRTKLCRQLAAVYVATCDVCIAQKCEQLGIQAIMTSPDHERCSDRVAEALLHIEASTPDPIDVVVMVQGDEPMVCPQMIDAALAPLYLYNQVQVVNLMADLHSIEEFEDPNEVKVVTDCAGDALYFSREAIPSRKKGGMAHMPMYKQVCIIPFRRDALLRFTALSPTPLEQIESIDMLRLLEHGEKVRMVHVQEHTLSVDTPEDLARVRAMMRDDALMQTYIATTAQKI